jgi:twitching motility protein PilT
MVEYSIQALLQEVVRLRGSDLHITTRKPPQVRVDGMLRRIEGPDCTPIDTARLAYSVMTASQRQRFETSQELDFSFGIEGLGRFRCNLFNQRGSVAAVYRVIPETIRSFEELGLPPTLTAFAERRRGLVLVTGSAGSGKSTTLAAIVDRISRERCAHILTIEDPIEFLHEHHGGLVNQREVCCDTQSFAAALRAALREDPDVVLIGEMRDRETVEAALRIAETGHLTLGTLHTSSAVQTVTRIVDVFPAAQQSQIRTQLALVLEGVICQTLVPRIGGGRVLSLEVMTATAAIRNLIRDNKIHQIYSAMQTGQESFGMQTANQSLAALHQRRLIAREAALSASPNQEELLHLLAQASRHRAGKA